MPDTYIEPVNIVPALANEKNNSFVDKFEVSINHEETKNAAATATTEKEKSPSPSTSTCSNAISIKSIEDNGDDDSTIADSDVEDVYIHSDDDIGTNIVEHSQGTVMMNCCPSTDGECSVLSTTASSTSALRPNIGSIAVQNSSDITFGNKTYYHGPVTIKQFMYDNKKWRPNDSANDNPAYNADAGDEEKKTDGTILINKFL